MIHVLFIFDTDRFSISFTCDLVNDTNSFSSGNIRSFFFAGIMKKQRLHTPYNFLFLRVRDTRKCTIAFFIRFSSGFWAEQVQNIGRCDGKTLDNLIHIAEYFHYHINGFNVFARCVMLQRLLSRLWFASTVQKQIIGGIIC